MRYRDVKLPPGQRTTGPVRSPLTGAEGDPNLMAEADLTLLFEGLPPLEPGDGMSTLKVLPRDDESSKRSDRTKFRKLSPPPDMAAGRGFDELGSDELVFNVMPKDRVRYPKRSVTVPMEDTRPPSVVPRDASIGGADQTQVSSQRSRARFTVTGTATSVSLNVSSPSNANTAQVLSAVLQVLQERGIVARQAS